LQTYTVRQ